MDFKGFWKRWKERIRRRLWKGFREPSRPLSEYSGLKYVFSYRKVEYEGKIYVDFWNPGEDHHIGMKKSGELTVPARNYDEALDNAKKWFIDSFRAEQAILRTDLP